MINSLLITPSPKRDRGNGPETRPGIEPSGRGDVIPNLPALGEPPHFRAGRRSDATHSAFDIALNIVMRLLQS